MPSCVVIDRSVWVLTVAVGLISCVRSSSPSEPSAWRYIESLQLEALTRASIRTTQDAVEFQVRLRNPRQESVEVTYGECALNPRFRDVSRADSVLWEWNKLDPPCRLYLMRSTIRPGATLDPPEFTLLIPVNTILGDSIARGIYSVTIVLQLRTNYVELSAGSLLIPEAASARPKEAIH